MLRGLYAAANAMRYRANEVDITANNIANATTDGYKRDCAAMRSFGDLLVSRLEDAPENNIGRSRDALFQLQPIPPMVGSMNLGGPAAENEYIDFSPGAPTKTGNPLDLFISGPGFFVVETPGGERYTRAGNFTLNGDGTLVNPSGHEVQGTNFGSINIRSSAPIIINRNGEITQDGVPVGRIRVVEFPDPQVLEKEGGTLFRAKDPIGAISFPASGSFIEQGALEKSNVDPIEALVRLISAQRAYEAASRAVDMFNESLTRVSQELGRIPG